MTQSPMHTANPDWGFFGTIRHHAEPEEAWPRAMKAIAAATGCSPDAVRDFLDSRHGRHFADDVANGLFKGLKLDAAIDAAVERWMGWAIGRRTSWSTGIPLGLPYLRGLVIACEIALEAGTSRLSHKPQYGKYTTTSVAARLQLIRLFKASAENRSVWVSKAGVRDTRPSSLRP